MEKLARTVSIHAICEMEKLNDKPASFNYDIALDIEGTGTIILTPADTNVTFRDAYLISSFDTTDHQNDYSRIFAINLVANMELNETEDDDYEIGINDVGEVVITPYAAFDGVEGEAKFISFEIEKDSILVTEIDAEENSISAENIEAEVITESDDLIDPSDEPEWRITYELPITEAVANDLEEPSNVRILNAPDAKTAAK